MVIERVEIVRHGAEATAALRARVAAVQADRPLAPVTVVVPSNFAGLAARHSLGRHGVANVGFVTPFRLAELLSTDILLDSRPLTNPVLGAAVRAALAHDPGPFAASARHRATEASVASLFSELSHLPAPVRAQLRAGGGTPGRAVALVESISARLGPFHQESDIAGAAAARPDLADTLRPLGHIIWFLPNPPLTAPLTRLIGAVLRAAPSTALVALTGVLAADTPVIELCRRVGVTVESARGLAPPVADTIVSVTDADEEIRTVVRRVVAVAEQGVSLDRVAVLYPSPDPYAALLERHLADAGLPANGPARRSLASTVPGRTLLAALDLPGQRWRRDRVMALISDAPVMAGARLGRPGAWELLTREAGIVAGRKDWPTKLGSYRDRLLRRAERIASGELAEPIEPIRRTVVDIDELLEIVIGLMSRLDTVDRSSSWAAKAAAAHDLLDHLLGSGHTHGWWPEAEQEAFERVEDSVARLAALDDIDPQPSTEVFGRALAAELDSPAGRRGRFGHGVFYGPLETAVGLDLDAVFVVGLTEGLCPRMPRRGCDPPRFRPRPSRRAPAVASRAARPPTPCVPGRPRLGARGRSHHHLPARRPAPQPHVDPVALAAGLGQRTRRAARPRHRSRSARPPPRDCRVITRRRDHRRCRASRPHRAGPRRALAPSSSNRAGRLSSGSPPLPPRLGGERRPSFGRVHGVGRQPRGGHLAPDHAPVADTTRVVGQLRVPLLPGARARPHRPRRSRARPRPLGPRSRFGRPRDPRTVHRRGAPGPSRTRPAVVARPAGTGP